MRGLGVVAVAVVALAAASAASARDPKEPQQRHTKADTAFARSVALRRSDLPKGWTARKASKGAPCSTEPDESGLVQTARIDPTFVWSDGLTTVGSEVDVFRSAPQAVRDWRLSTLALMRRCLLESARRTLGKQHVTVKLVSAKALRAPKLGERSLHYRLVLQLHEAKTKTTVPIVTELIAIGIGRTSVVLHALARGTALPASGLDSLVSLLAKRLVAASGGI